MGEKVDYNYTDEFYIGNIQSDSGEIGYIENKIFGREFIGRLENHLDKGTPIDELMENIAHVLRLNLNNTTIGDSFTVKTTKRPPFEYKVEAFCNARIWAEFILQPKKNHLRIEVSCTRAQQENVEEIVRAINDVLHNARTLDDGWGEDADLF